MAELLTEIAGSENMFGEGSALDALIGFYRAFNTADLEALAANWADGGKPRHGQSDRRHPARMAVDP